MYKAFCKLVLKIIGFKVTGSYPFHIKKKMLIVVPHTSNWDFPLGLLVKGALGFNVNFLAKNSLFKPPFGWFFKLWGGVPVNRSKSTNTVRNISQKFEEVEELTLVIAPEGTRRKVDTFKKGFYYIAKNAGIPIIPIKFDRAHKVVDIGELFMPTDDADADFEFFYRYFDGVAGIVKENSFGIPPKYN